MPILKNRVTGTVRSDTGRFIASTQTKGISKGFAIYPSVGTTSVFGEVMRGSYAYHRNEVASTLDAINILINAPSSDWWIKARARLKQLGALETDWNGYESAAPNTTSLHWATLIVDRLYDGNIVPAKVVPSATGGIAICFIKNNKYADIEALNSGDIVVLTKDKATGVRNVWTVLADEDEIQRALERIAIHIN